MTDHDRAGARDRFEDVVGEVTEPVRRYLHRRIEAHLADDVLAEVLVVLWRRLDAVPASDEIAWAIGVARLQLANAERTRRRQHRLFHRVATLDPPPTATAHAARGGTVDDSPRKLGHGWVAITDLMDGPLSADVEDPADRAQQDVRSVLSQMRPGDAEILRLWAWDELAPREIATVLEISTNAATVRLHRARRRFETAWSKTRDTGGHESAKEGSER